MIVTGAFVGHVHSVVTTVATGDGVVGDSVVGAALVGDAVVGDSVVGGQVAGLQPSEPPVIHVQPHGLLVVKPAQRSIFSWSVSPKVARSVQAG